MTGDAPRPTLLLDSPSLIYRAFFAVPATIRSPQGRPVNAARGYLDMCARMLTDRRPAGMVHTLDADWRPAFRVAAYPGYKSTRRPDPPDLPWQFELIAEVLDALGMQSASAPGYEADDVLGTLAVRAGDTTPVEIVTGDRDLLQLVRDPAVTVLFTVKGVRELARFDEAAVRAKYGVPPSGYVDMAILRGDPSDGLPGVAGIGEKTAARLVAEHGSIAAMLALPQGSRTRAALEAAGPYLAAMRRVVPVVTDLPVTLRPPRPPDRERCAAIGAREAIDGPVTRLLAALDALAASG